MKRYFSVVPRNADKSDGAGSDSPAAKRPSPATPKSQPTLFLTHNVNSLNARLVGGEARRLSELILSLRPCVVTLQEVKLCASDPDHRGAVHPKHHKLVRPWEAPLRDLYSIHWSLADKGYAGTCLLIRRDIAYRSIRFCLEDPAEDCGAGNSRKAHSMGRDHDPEGRVALVTFDSLVFLATYSPNNGTTEASIARRVAWDARVERFVRQVAARGTPVVWGGDLNCAPANEDMSHVEFFKRRDQPGCTDAEQRRLRSLMAAGQLVDAYRVLHPMSHSLHPQAGFTWRGQEAGMFMDKSMRIDLFLVSRCLLPRVTACGPAELGADEGTEDVTGPSNRNAFLGSDHRPVLLRLAPLGEGGGGYGATGGGDGEGAPGGVHGGDPPVGGEGGEGACPLPSSTMAPRLAPQADGDGVCPLPLALQANAGGCPPPCVTQPPSPPQAEGM
eukprot:jgi/Mesvir1/12138/Mv00391-RA.1